MHSAIDRMDFDINQQANVIIRGLKWLGVWKLDGWPEKLYIVYAIFTYSTVTVCMVVLFLNLILDDDLEVFFNCLNLFLSVFGTWMKVNNILFFRRKYYFKFISSIKDVDLKPKSESELNFYIKEYSSFGFILKAYITCPVGVCSLAALSSLIASDYIRPYPMWMPFNWKTKENYWYAYGITIFLMNYSCLICVFMDLFHTFVLCYVAIIYKVLNYRLEGLGRSTRKEGNLSELIQVMDFERRIKMIAINGETIVSSPILTQTLLSAFVLCLTAYQLKNMSILITPGPFLQIADYAIVMSLQIYLPCFYGNEVTIHSGSLSSALYHSNWIDMNIKTKKMIFIYMEYLKRPAVLKAGNFFEIGLGVFSKVMNNAYSLFALLLNMNN